MLRPQKRQRRQWHNDDADDYDDHDDNKYFYSGVRSSSSHADAHTHTHIIRFFFLSFVSTLLSMYDEVDVKCELMPMTAIDFVCGIQLNE